MIGGGGEEGELNKSSDGMAVRKRGRERGSEGESFQRLAGIEEHVEMLGGGGGERRNNTI
jgi:hypothetical protein